MPRLLRHLPLPLIACLCALATFPTFASAAKLPAPSATWVGRVAQTSGEVRWTPVRGATSYDVIRSGKRSASVRGTAVKLANLRPATYYDIRIRARIGPRIGATGDPAPFVTRPSTACTRWVSAGGSDTAVGSQTAPWRTVQHLVNSWRPGDVGCVLSDIAEDITIARGGELLTPVTLRSAPGRRATITGRIQISRGADHVVVAGFILDGRALRGAGAGDLPSPTINGNDARFLENDVHNQRTRVCFVIGSIRGWGRSAGSLLARNRIHDCGARDAGGHGNNHHHGVYVEGADSTRIVGNVIFQNADRGIQLYPDAKGTLVLGNVIDGNGEGIIFSGAEGYASSGNTVLRNVVSNSRTRSNIEHWWENPARPGTRNVAARNCIGAAQQGGFALPIVGYSAVGNVTGDPQWAAAATGDFRLRSRGATSCWNWLRSAGTPLAALPTP